MKKLFLMLMAVVMLVPSLVCAREEGELPETEYAVSRIGDTEFVLTNTQEYYDFSYRYPNEFELEIKEDSDRIRHVLRYHVEGYDPTAVGLVISRTNRYATPEERLRDCAFLDVFTAEDINGVTWSIGSQTDTSEDSVTVYACAAGEYIYTFSFSTDYPADFDYAEFAKAFVGEVKSNP